MKRQPSPRRTEAHRDDIHVRRLREAADVHALKQSASDRAVTECPGSEIVRDLQRERAVAALGLGVGSTSRMPS